MKVAPRRSALSQSIDLFICDARYGSIYLSDGLEPSLLYLVPSYMT